MPRSAFPRREAIGGGAREKAREDEEEKKEEETNDGGGGAVFFLDSASFVYPRGTCDCDRTSSEGVDAHKVRAGSMGERGML